MIKKMMSCLITCLLLLYLSPLPAPAWANEADDNKEAQELLQKGLTIYEIDREVARLNEQDTKIVGQIQQTQIDIEKQGNKVKDTRKHAGKVLRAHYTGERDSIWLLLFSVRSFADILKTFEYLNMIVQNDHKALTKFTDSFNQLKDLNVQLEGSRVKLQLTKDNYLKQRERLVALQEELDKQLAISTQTKVVEEKIQSLKNEWEQEGLPLFRQYFEALSVAFMALPELVMKNDGANFSLNNFTMTDQAFNEFLISKNELFKTLQFDFTKTNVMAKGLQNGKDIRINGNFIVKVGTDMNEVLYQIDQLSYNGYQLPDTTIASLSDEFKLSFIPKLTTKNLIEVTAITNEEDKLIIKLKISF
ncbi:hypothetical protein D3C73_620180 [compost metagenome]